MKVLVVGASGFVGQNLMELLSDNYTLTGTSRFNHTSFLKLNMNNIDVFDFTKYDVVINLAGLAHKNPKYISKDDYFIANYLFPLRLHMNCKKAGIKRFIHLSTINVYNVLSINSNSIVHPTTDFSASKLCFDYYLQHSECPHTIIRSPLIYGKGLKANLLFLYNLCGKNIPLPFGAISNNKRSFVSVYNLIDLIDVCINDPRALNKTFLVSDDNDLSTKEIVKIMSSLQGVNPWLLPIPVCVLKYLAFFLGRSVLFKRLTESLIVDISNTKNSLNWNPPLSVREGFERFIKE